MRGFRPEFQTDAPPPDFPAAGKLNMKDRNSKISPLLSKAGIRRRIRDRRKLCSSSESVTFYFIRLAVVWYLSAIFAKRFCRAARRRAIHVRPAVSRMLLQISTSAFHE